MANGKAITTDTSAYNALSFRLRKLVDAFLLTGAERRAGELVGFSQLEREMAFRSMPVQVAIAEELKRAVLSDGALASMILRTVAVDTVAPATSRVAAARTLIAPWHAMVAAGATATDTRTLSELSVDQLRAIVDKLEAERGNQATLVNASEDDLIG